jgi:hypothetical protein
MDSIKNSQFDEQGRFILRSFDQARPFSSFLPGIGGLHGIPMWVFYANRGQAITSFGVESKDHPIMEFQPANKAYQLTATLGFRTFLNGDGWFAEPFSPSNRSQPQRDMFIGMNEIEIRETDQELGIETSVVYFNLLNEPLAGLVRQVSFRNIGTVTLSFEVLDGMPALMPYGLDNGLLKHIGRTIEAWMEVFEVEGRIPFYRLRASAGDTSQVRAIESGHYALAVAEGELLPAFVDPVLLFGTDTSFTFPQQKATEIDQLARESQITEGRTPCAFFGKTLEIKPGETKTISSVFGFVDNFKLIQEHSPKILTPDYLQTKRAESQAFTMKLTDPIATRSADPLFDAYTRQTFLDNLMRGGWPEILGDKHVYHVYSRKHGDPERDYNHFFLAAENFSQGNSNYRDVNQNRRSDVFFEPRSGDFNIRLFMSLIQTDGYNPLVVQGTNFTLAPEKLSNMLEQVEAPERLSDVLSGSFTPGELLRAAAQSRLKSPPQQFLDLVIREAQQHIQADFHEGYWVDHWTYNLDLIESYLAVFPDKKSALLFDSEPLPFFESPAVVKPRSEKYVLENDLPRQYDAIAEDDEKLLLINSRTDQPNWVRTEFGRGEIFRVPLFSKLALVAIIKFTALDPFGMGIEMEAGRPGWYDALNGLPGLFGSSFPETLELLRLINFLTESLQLDPRQVEIPVELEQLLQDILAQLKTPQTDFEYWDQVSTCRENYRDKTKLGVSGNTASIPAEDLLKAFQVFKDKLKVGINRAVEENAGLPPTYFSNTLSEYELEESPDQPGQTSLRPISFTQSTLPLFLEGPVRQMKIFESQAQARALHDKVKASDLFDTKLGMYKLNASLLGESHEIGRARAFSPGWLENESIWLHMSYKYLLEILKAGLYDQFFSEIKTNMPPFMDPAIYGRSPLENSSFIVSSAHPDSSLHGNGFVARLSGSTAEFLNIWQLMMIGPEPFRMQDGQLLLNLRPALPGWLFSEQGTLSFKFMGGVEVTYHNPERKDTFSAGLIPHKTKLIIADGNEVSINEDSIPAPFAEMVRSGKVAAIEIFYK